MLLTTNYCTIDQSHIPYALKVNPLKSHDNHFFLNLLKIPIVKNCRHYGIMILEKKTVI